MDKSDIEHMICECVRQAAEKGIVDAFDALKKAGHQFEMLDSSLVQWKEAHTNNRVDVLCTVSVHHTDSGCISRVQDPVVDSFIARAESGEDPSARMLNQLEGGISNGGLYQVYENNGARFLEDCATLLREIGAKHNLKIILEALDVLDRNQEHIKKCAEMKRKLHSLDIRFWKLKESIAELYEHRRLTGPKK